MSTRKTVHTNLAPEAIGPYSQAICVDDLIFTAGQIPLDPATGQLLQGSFPDQVQQVLRNLAGILSTAGSDLDHVVKFTVFLTSMDDYPLLNEVFGRYFTTDPPARSVVQVAGLPLGARLEIDAIALLHS